MNTSASIDKIRKTLRERDTLDEKALHLFNQAFPSESFVKWRHGKHIQRGTVIESTALGGFSALTVSVRNTHTRSIVRVHPLNIMEHT